MGQAAGCLEVARGSYWRRQRSHGRVMHQLFDAFEHACDLEDAELAGGILAVVENALSAETDQQDRPDQILADKLIQAHFRLLELRYHR